jgi:hypothetical protein
MLLASTFTYTQWTFPNSMNYNATNRNVGKDCLRIGVNLRDRSDHLYILSSQYIILPTHYKEGYS